MMKRTSWLLTLILLSGMGHTKIGTNLEFSGMLVSKPCKVETESEEQVISFGLFYLTSLRTDPKPFSIKLKECNIALSNKVLVTFTGTEDTDQKGTFKITGEAKGIAIALEDSNGNAIKPGVATAPMSLVNGVNDLKFQAYVQAADLSKVTEGIFVSLVNFTLEYQ